MIRYKEGYKYQLVEDSINQITILGYTVKVDFIELTPFGQLIITKGYAWDGPSGPTIDTKNFMRGSLVHDALYQLMREGCIPITCKDSADRILQSFCLADGMSQLRAWYVYQGVHLFGYGSAKLQPDKIQTAE